MSDTSDSEDSWKSVSFHTPIFKNEAKIHNLEREYFQKTEPSKISLDSNNNDIKASVRSEFTNNPLNTVPVTLFQAAFYNTKHQGLKAILNMVKGQINLKLLFISKGSSIPNSFVKVPHSKFSEFTNVMATIHAGISIGNVPLNDELVEQNGARSRFLYHFQKLQGTGKEFEHGKTFKTGLEIIGEEIKLGVNDLTLSREEVSRVVIEENQFEILKILLNRLFSIWSFRSTIGMSNY